MTSTVSWGVRDDSAASVRVVVADPGRMDSRLFAEGGATGRPQTENWVRFGAWFALQDAGSTAELGP